VRGDLMPTPIKITAGSVSLTAELDDTALAKAVAAKLPIETTPNEWGDEFYFGIPVQSGLDETATKKVKVGDIGFWPPGNAMAIFFGPTPMSSGVDPVPASAVCLLGRITGDATLLRQALGARTIRIEKTRGERPHPAYHSYVHIPLQPDPGREMLPMNLPTASFVSGTARNASCGGFTPGRLNAGPATCGERWNKTQIKKDGPPGFRVEKE
jgi:hypothetical protein